MATYYIDYVNGSDSNNGLGPDASAGTNKPWATLSKALSAGSPVVGGDTIYMAPGIHRMSASITIGITISSNLNILGDPGNVQGFKTSGGVLVKPDQVVFTAYLVDTTQQTFGIIYNGHYNISWQYIYFEGSSAVMHQFGTVSSSTNVNFTDCCLDAGHQSSGVVTATAAFGVALNITFDRCIIVSKYIACLFTCTQGTGSDYDINVVFKNCLIAGMGDYCVSCIATGTGANLGNGMHLRNCTLIGNLGVWCQTASGLSTTFPTTIYNSYIWCGNGMTAATSGQITEDYNAFNCQTSRTNVTAGTHSNNSASTRMHFGQEKMFGFQQRPFLEPMAVSGTLGFNNDGSQTTYDGLNRPRASGGQQTAAGWIGRGNTAAQGTSPAPPSGTYTWQGTGPWYQDFQLPVSAATHTISIVTQHDANYTGTKPQMLILAQPEIGVSAQTITDTGGSGSWNTLTSSSFTPTTAGVVTVRLISGDTSGISVAEFANFSVT